MTTKYSISFVIFNIFTIYISCFCAICILFFIEPIHIFFLLPFFCSTHFVAPCVFCSICSTFPFFTIFSAIATVSAAISCLFAPSFCLFAAYQLILFHFYFIYKNESCYGGLFKFTEKFNEVSWKLKKETPSLFRSSVSDICSSSVLSQFRRMMQNSAIPCFVTFRYFLLFGRSHPQSAPSPQSSFRQSCG